MVKTQVRVVSVNPSQVLVEPVESGGCGACHARSACGIGGLARYLWPRRQPIAVPCALPARAGDEFTLAVAAGDLLKAALLAYLVPIAMGVLAAGLAAVQTQSDGAAAIGLLAGTASGLYLARRYGRRIPISAQSGSAITDKGDTP